MTSIQRAGPLGRRRPGPPKSDLTQVQKDIILDLYGSYKSIRKINEVVKTSRKKIAEFLDETGARRIKHWVSLPADKIDQIIVGNNLKLPMVELARQTGLGSSTIDRFICANGMTRKLGNTRCQMDEHFFHTIDTEEKAYWLGFLYADGCVRADGQYLFHLQMSLSSKDRRHLEKFKDSIGFSGKISDFKNTTGYRTDLDYSRIDLSSKSMIRDLIKQGCTPRKSLILKFPNAEQVPEHLTNHFIRGYFDGDGCVNTNFKNKTCRISFCGTLEFLTRLQKLLNDMKINAHIGKRHDNLVNCYDLTLNGAHQSMRFYRHFFYDGMIFLDRKLLKFVEFFEFYKTNVRNIRNKQEVGEFLNSIDFNGVQDLRRTINSASLQARDPCRSEPHLPIKLRGVVSDIKASPLGQIPLVAVDLFPFEQPDRIKTAFPEREHFTR